MKKINFQVDLKPTKHEGKKGYFVSVKHAKTIVKIFEEIKGHDILNDFEMQIAYPYMEKMNSFVQEIDQKLEELKKEEKRFNNKYKEMQVKINKLEKKKK